METEYGVEILVSLAYPRDTSFIPTQGRHIKFSNLTKEQYVALCQHLSNIMDLAEYDRDRMADGELPHIWPRDW